MQRLTVGFHTPIVSAPPGFQVWMTATSPQTNDDSSYCPPDVINGSNLLPAPTRGRRQEGRAFLSPGPAGAGYKLRPGASPLCTWKLAVCGMPILFGSGTRRILSREESTDNGQQNGFLPCRRLVFCTLAHWLSLAFRSPFSKAERHLWKMNSCDEPGHH